MHYKQIRTIKSNKIRHQKSMK